MPREAEALLVGPRGRRLCLEFAKAAARDTSGGHSRDVGTAIMFAAYDLDPDRDSGSVETFGGADPDLRVDWSPDDVAGLLRNLPLPEPDPASVLQALAMAVDFARYWQEPDGEDVLAATPAVRSALERIADHLTGSVATAWWDEPITRSNQHLVHWEDPERPPHPDRRTTREKLTAWRADAIRDEDRARTERPADPTAPYSGVWWSTPPRDLTTSTRERDSLGPVGLWWFEDAFDWRPATVARVDASDDANVYEVDGPDAWAHLCRTYPFDVSAGRRHDWFRATGDVRAWVIPDWLRVADDYDAVHLTVFGYVTGAGRAIAVGRDHASVIAGWNPDETFWLTDVAAGETRARWERDDDHGWRRR